MRNKESEVQMGCKAIVIATIVAISMVFSVTAGEAVAIAVTAQQRYPWNGKVDIAVKISGASNDAAQAVCTFVATNRATQAALSISHITSIDGATGSDNMWTRRFVWDAVADVGEVKIDDVLLAVMAEIPIGGVQLWKDGPFWAECNVGASKPEEYGYYFYWGGVTGYTCRGGTWMGYYYDNVTWVYSDGHRSDSPFTYAWIIYGMTTSELRSEGYIDSTGNLTAAHDAATSHFGAPWRMPTDTDFGDLISKCDTTWTTRNGVYGRKVTGRGAYASKSIFLPAAGDGVRSEFYGPGESGLYWSSTPYSVNSYDACDLQFTSSQFERLCGARYLGRSVRPLRDFTKSSSLTTSLMLDCRTGDRVANAREMVFFSPNWETTVAGATAMVSMNGVSVTNATDGGALEWTPTRNGTYTFTHAVFVNGESVGDTLNATFIVEGLNPIPPVIVPANGTIIDDSQSIMISCEDEDVQIHYTIDGSEPTADSSVYQKRFRVSGKAIVKAISMYDNGKASEVVVARYAQGQCPDPVIVSAGGETFLQKGNQVSLDWDCADGVLRYTTDGSDVTETSPEYAGAFTIDETTAIKAKAFGETYFDSQQVEMTIRYLMHTITFDSCGGSEIPSVLLQEELAYGGLPEPTREGCVFLGWYTEPKGGERVTSDTLVDVDRTLYAHWRGILDVKVFSGMPWQEIVIGYTIVGSESTSLGLRTIVSDNDTGIAWTNETYGGEALSEGRHQFKWNEAKVCSTNLEVKLQFFEPTYCVIDLAGGASAESYPLTYLNDIPNGGWTDEYKTTKLVLRRIEAGSFIMGEDRADETRGVTLTKPFYMGVFEVTQKQYELVTMSNPSAYKGDSRPVERISYNMIRGSLMGSQWPSNNLVDVTSFLGMLRAKTRIDLDLPTEAQWEYACRAGTSSSFNNGGTSADDLNLIGRYKGNKTDGKGGCSDAHHTTVGCYQPNAWGLYDMHGNVWEWCLDWHDSQLISGSDVKGPCSGANRVLRGGSWGFPASTSTSFSRHYNIPSYLDDGGGFRLSQTCQCEAELEVPHFF